MRGAGAGDRGGPAAGPRPPPPQPLPRARRAAKPTGGRHLGAAAGSAAAPHLRPRPRRRPRPRPRPRPAAPSAAARGAAPPRALDPAARGGGEGERLIREPAGGRGAPRRVGELRPAGQGRRRGGGEGAGHPRPGSRGCPPSPAAARKLGVRREFPGRGGEASSAAGRPRTPLPSRQRRAPAPAGNLARVGGFQLCPPCLPAAQSRELIAVSPHI